MELVHSGHAALAKLISATAKWTDTAARSRPLVWPTYNSLPVAGLDVLTAQTVLYTLKTSLPTDQVQLLTIILSVNRPTLGAFK